MADPGSSPDNNAVVARFDEALEQLALARKTAPMAPNREVLKAALCVMATPDGLDALYARVSEIEAKGVFTNGDWGKPAILRPAIAVRTLRKVPPSIPPC